MVRRAWVLGVVVAACTPPPVVEMPRANPVAARVEQRVLVASGRPSGTFTTTTASDGTIRLEYAELQNGRGSKISATLALAPDWTLASYRASGTHLLGSPLSATFERTGDVARWDSPEERGQRQVAGPALFVPIGDLPIDWLIVPAALKAGGVLPLLPGGEARVKQVAELDVAANGDTQHLVGYVIDGLGLEPRYTWFRPDGSWFGTAHLWTSVVPAGWETAVEPLLAKQDELERARDAKLAMLHATRPVTGFALTNARVLDVEKGTWAQGQTVLVLGDTIKAVGPTGKVKIPAGVDTVAVDGLGVMPGLIDMHTHLTAADGLLDIAAGVTTVRDLGNDPDRLDDLKKRFDAGSAIGPHVVRLGFIEGRGVKAAGSKVTAETPDEAKAAVEEFAKRGYEGIKIYNSVRPELVPLLAADAHARGMFVSGHVPVHMRASEVIAAGYDGIEHINMLFLNFFATKETDTRDTTRFTLVGDKAADLALDSPQVRELFEQLRQKKTVVCPTLAAFEPMFVGVPGRVPAGLEDTVARLPLATARTFMLGGLPMPGATQQLYARSWDKLLAMVKALWEAKVHLVVGTDHINGIMLHHEMELFARAGIPTRDVIRMATLDAARAMKLDKKLGTIAPGKRADLVIVQGDPIADLKAMRHTVFTMRAGVLFKTEALYAAAGVKP